MAVAYEWDVETLDPESGDILDHDFRDHLADFDHYSIEDLLGGEHDLCIMRDSGDEFDGITERTWAYADLIDGILVLPDEFENGKPIPKRFKQEFSQWAKRRFA